MDLFFLILVISFFYNSKAAAAAAASATGFAWEWYNSGGWTRYEDGDSAKMESALRSGSDQLYDNVNVVNVNTTFFFENEN